MTSDWATLYEQLRQAIDGGSESMTHEDALQQIAYWCSRDNIITNPKAIRETFEADALHEIDLASEDWVDSQLGEL